MSSVPSIVIYHPQSYHMSVGSQSTISSPSTSVGGVPLRKELSARPKEYGLGNEEIGKMFVGGLSWDTGQEALLRYFSRFGPVTDCVVMKNTETGRSRGFGFVTYSDPSIIGSVLSCSPHILNGRTIDPKACNPRSMQKHYRQSSWLPKIFLGGLPSSTTETDLRNFFSQFGEVCEVIIMFDQEKRKSRGFGFLSFKDSAAVNRAVCQHFVVIHNKQVEIKPAEPRLSNYEFNQKPLPRMIYPGNGMITSSHCGTFSSQYSPIDVRPPANWLPPSIQPQRFNQVSPVSYASPPPVPMMAPHFATTVFQSPAQHPSFNWDSSQGGALFTRGQEVYAQPPQVYIPKFSSTMDAFAAYASQSMAHVLPGSYGIVPSMTMGCAPPLSYFTIAQATDFAETPESLALGFSGLREPS